MDHPDLLGNLIHRVNVGDSLTRTAARTPQAIALVDSEQTLTYAQFNSEVNRTARSLLSLGVSAEVPVALASGNCAEFLVIYYACAKIGAVCVPINLGWRSDEITYVLGDSGAQVFAVQSALADAMAPCIDPTGKIRHIITIGDTAVDFGVPSVTVDAVRQGQSIVEPEVFVDDRAPLTYLYTSGTTSAPKGVIGNHTAIYLESMSMVVEGGFNATDRFAALLPMFHTAQLNCHCTTAVMVGATIHILPGFDAGALLELIQTEAITQIFALPMMFRAMLEHPDIRTRDLSSLRRALYAMAPMPQEMLKQCLKTFDCEFYLLFGQTEMSPTATIFKPEHQLSHPGAAGTPALNVQVEIMDENGMLLKRGHTGEIVYRGPHVMTGYLGNSEATSAAFTHGWFHSGDIGYIGHDGILWFTDRRKDIIKTGGENVASLEVEKAVYAAAPDVAEAVVVGLPHDHWSEAITAFVVLDEGSDMDGEAVRAALRSHLDAYKIPKSVVVVESLPRTSTGKIQKNVIRDRYTDLYRP